MDNSGADKVGSKAVKAKGVGIVAAVEGRGSAVVSVGNGKGDAVASVCPGRGNMRNTAPSSGRGNMAASVGRGNTAASSGHAAESSAAIGGRGDVPVGGSVRGFAVGVAGDSLPSRGPEVPLPVPNPTIGVAGDINNIWCHGKSTSGNGWICGYCGVSRHGGGATRFKDHLAGIGGNCHSCLNVPHHVARVFRAIIPEGKDTRRKKKEAKIRVQEEVDRGNNINTSIDISDEDDILDATMRRTIHAHMDGNSNGAGCSSVRANSAAGKASQTKAYFDRELAYAKTRSQQTLEVCIKKAEYGERLGKAWSKWFHANDIPGHKANCPYFIGALKLTQDLGKGVPAPKGSEIDGIYLQSNYEELQEYVSKFKDDWATYGVTLMTDSWTGPTRMSIINFMVFSNGRMYFHKSVNATGNIQNSQFVYEHIKEVIVNEIGPENVVQIVTDNGSNFKRACLDIVADYPHISWQPCAAHTLNLMLKEIGSFPEIDAVVTSAKRMCRFFYNHSTLHAEMHNKIGGELVRPNATRFGTVFMFLQSFWDKQEHFKVWMTSPEWQNSSWSNEADYDYTYDCLTNRKWWENVRRVLDIIKPLYIVLRYADSQKIGTLSGFMPRMMSARLVLSGIFPEGSADQDKYLMVMDRRIEHLYNNTLMAAATVLDPEGHYKHNFAKKLTYVNALSSALKKMAPQSEYIALIPQVTMYINCTGIFDSALAREAALSLSPIEWWVTFGGETELLQKYALRIVSQCISSSGCERNWSTFALIHTQVRNRLSFEKIHKMVSCHYNLQMRIRQIVEYAMEKEVDPCAMVMDASLFDNESPIMDWLTHSMSESEPLMDEYDGFHNYSPAPAVVEVVQKRVKRKRSVANLEDEEEEEEEEEEDEEEDEEEGEEDDDADTDTEDEDDLEELPLLKLRKSTRKKKKSLKVLANLCAKQG